MNTEITQKEEQYRDLVIDFALKQARERLVKKGVFVDSDTTPTYVIYCRKSTDEPDRQERSLEDQLTECTKLVKSLQLKVYKISEPILESESAKVSGKRRLFDGMVDEIRRGKKYNSIVCWSPDRLARNMLEAGMIIDLLVRGVIKDIKFVTFNFTNDHNGLLTLGFHFLMAKDYSDVLSENVKRGQSNILEEGRSPNRKHTYGYLVDDFGNYMPDGKNFDLIKKSFEMALSGIPFMKIVQFLKENELTIGGKVAKITSQKLSNILRSPLYAGLLMFGIRYKNLRESNPTFIPMISYEDFYNLRLKYDEKTNFRRKWGQIELLRGMVYCDYCGRFMAPDFGKGAKRYLYIKCMNRDHCPSYQLKPKGNPIRSKEIFDLAHTVLIKGMRMSEKEFKEHVASGLGEQERAVNALITRLRVIKNQIAALQKKIDECRSMATNMNASQITRDNELKTMDRLNQQKSELVIQEENVTKEIEVEKSKEGTQYFSYEGFSNFCKLMGESVLNQSKKEEMDTVLRMAFSNFVVRDKKILKYQYNPNFRQYLNPSTYPKQSGW